MDKHSDTADGWTKLPDDWRPVPTTIKRKQLERLALVKVADVRTANGVQEWRRHQ